MYTYTDSIFRHPRTSEGGLSAAVGSSVLEGIATIGETSTSLEAGEALALWKTIGNAGVMEFYGINPSGNVTVCY